MIDEGADLVAEACGNPEPELVDWVFDVTELTAKSIGFVGSGKAVTESLESIIVTVDIGGRSDESACVHKSPT